MLIILYGVNFLDRNKIYFINIYNQFWNQSKLVISFIQIFHILDHLNLTLDINLI